jgi:hypothetical protein
MVVPEIVKKPVEKSERKEAMLAGIWDFGNLDIYNS